MNAMLAIMRRELRSYFLTPVSPEKPVADHRPSATMPESLLSP